MPYSDMREWVLVNREVKSEEKCHSQFSRSQSEIKMTQDQEENFQKKFLRILENRDSRRSLPTAAIVPVLAIES